MMSKEMDGKILSDEICDNLKIKCDNLKANKFYQIIKNIKQKKKLKDVKKLE